MGARLMHTPLAPSTLLEDVCEISRRAGEKIMEIYQGDECDVKYKKDKSPVTDADLASDKLIAQGLHKLTPDWPVLSEESSDMFPFAQRSRWPVYWLVDPLDGTKGFIKRNGHFTVNIALVVNHKVRLGVIYMPYNRKLYYAASGFGAYRRIDAEPTQTITVCQSLRKRPIVVVSRAHINVPTRQLLEKIGEHELVRADSSLKCCLVADGSADLYLRVGPTCEWDTAAGQCIVEEAGGYLTDTGSVPIEYNRKDSLINPPFVVHTPSSPAWKEFMSSVTVP